MSRHGQAKWILGLGFASLCTAMVLWAQPRHVEVEPQLSSGEELVAIFIASSTCAGIEDPRLPEAVGDAMDYVQTRALIDGARFVKVGVGLDTDVEAASGVLRKFGEFDELHLGGSFLNAAAVHYLSTLHGNVGVPQLVVVRRTVTVRGGLSWVEAEEVVVRKVGVDDISEWAAAATAEL